MIRANRQLIFERTPLDDDCDTCDYLKEIPDMYGTGDSPSYYKCQGDWFSCKKVEEKVNEIDEWMREYPEYIELIKETR